MTDASDSKTTQWKRRSCHSKLTFPPLLWFSAAQRWKARRMNLTNWQNKVELLSLLVIRRPHLRHPLLCQLVPLFSVIPSQLSHPTAHPSSSRCHLIVFDFTTFAYVSSIVLVHRPVLLPFKQHTVTEVLALQHNKHYYILESSVME